MGSRLVYRQNNAAGIDKHHGFRYRIQQGADQIFTVAGDIEVRLGSFFFLSDDQLGMFKLTHPPAENDCKRYHCGC